MLTSLCLREGLHSSENIGVCSTSSMKNIILSVMITPLGDEGILPSQPNFSLTCENLAGDTCPRPFADIP